MTPKAKGKGASKAKSKGAKPAARPAAAAGTASRKLGGRFVLINCVIQRGFANQVAKAAMDAGAKGATILPARGMGVGQLLGALGHSIVPQKEVIMIVAVASQSKAIFEAVSKAAHLDQLGQGIAYDIPIYDVNGLFQDA